MKILVSVVRFRLGPPRILRTRDLVHRIPIVNLDQAPFFLASQYTTWLETFLKRTFNDVRIRDKVNSLLYFMNILLGRFNEKALLGFN